MLTISIAFPSMMSMEFSSNLKTSEPTISISCKKNFFSPMKPQRTLVPSFHLSIYLSFFPPFFDLHVIHLIYQVKGISGHQWVCVGCVRVCLGVHGCAQVCTGVCGCTWVCAGMHKCAGVYPGVCGYA